MRRKQKDKTPEIKLRQPDRSGPTDETLLKWAEERKLFEQAEQKLTKVKPAQESDDEDDGEPLSPRAERIMETILWTVSLAMMHGTLDVMVQNQYGIEIEWAKIVSRTAWAFLSSSSNLVSGKKIHQRRSISFTAHIADQA